MSLLLNNLYHYVNVIVAGDMNIDLKLSSKIRDKYLDLLAEQGLKCGITDYTRIEKRLNLSTQSCIDHIFVRSHTTDACTAAVNTVLADHRLVAIALCSICEPNVNNCTTSKQIPMYDPVILGEELCLADWSRMDGLQSPQQMYTIIKDNFDNAYSKAMRIITKNSDLHRQAPWVNKKLINLGKKRDKLFHKWKKDPNDVEARLEYNKKRNKVNKVTEYYRNSYYKNKIIRNFTNSRKLWQILNDIAGRIVKSIDEVVINAFKSLNILPKQIADNFAINFDKAVKDILPKCDINLLNIEQNSMSDNASICSMNFKKATPDSVCKLINKLSIDKAPGFDCIRMKDIKGIANIISVPLANFINTCIKAESYPDELKVGCVRPVHKKGKFDDTNNYRPITLTSSIDKIAEKYISNQIHAFYEKNNILSSCQFGFRPGKNTAMLLSDFTDQVNTWMNQKLHVLALFIDFSRAFDTLDHKKLITRLEYTGIRGPLLNWCKNYLINRSYSVKICESYSRPITVTEGTAQGSVLGPLHFIAYVNDMTKVLNHSKTFQYADDTCLLVAAKDANDASILLQEDFDKLTKWCHDSGLILNSQKTKLVHIHSPNLISHNTLEYKIIAHTHYCLHHPQVSCNCATIEVVESHKYLGLIIDHKFNWHEHIMHVCDKLRAFLANMFIIRKRLNYKAKMLLYNALADSIISYGLSSYGRTNKSYLESIYKLQVRILKAIVPCNVKVKAKANEHLLFEHCRVIKIKDKVQYQLLKEQFFNLNLQQVMSNKVQTRSVARKKLITKMAKNKYGERTTAYLIPRLINSLDSNLKGELTKQNLKRKLQLYFLRKT